MILSSCGRQQPMAGAPVAADGPATAVAPASQPVAASSRPAKPAFTGPFFKDLNEALAAIPPRPTVSSSGAISTFAREMQLKDLADWREKVTTWGRGCHGLKFAETMMLLDVGMPADRIQARFELPTGAAVICISISAGEGQREFWRMQQPRWYFRVEGTIDEAAILGDESIVILKDATFFR
jgi:hypothetical protein